MTLRNSRLLSSAVIYTAGNFISMSIPFLLLPVYTIFLSSNDFGIVGAMQTMNAVIVIVFTLGVERSIYRLYHDYSNDSDTRLFLQNVIVAITVISTLSSFLFFLFPTQLCRLFPGIPFYPYFVIAILTSYFSTFSMVPMIAFQVQQNAKLFFIVSMLQATLKTAFSVLFLVILKKGVVGFLFAELLVNVLFAPYFIVYAVRMGRYRFDAGMLANCLKFSLPFIPVLLSSWILNFSSKVFINKYYSLSDLGVFTLSEKLSSVLLLLISGCWQAYSPYFYKLASTGEEHDRRKINDINHYFILLIVVSVFVVSYWSTEIFKLFGKEYNSGTSVLPLMLVALLFSQIVSFFNSQIYQAKKTFLITVFVFFAAALNIALGILIIPKHGVLGAAFIGVIVNVALCVAEYFAAQKVYRLEYRFLTVCAYCALFLGIYVLVDYSRMLPMKYPVFVSLKSVLFLGAFAAILLINKKKIVKVCKS